MVSTRSASVATVLTLFAALCSCDGHGASELPAHAPETVIGQDAARDLAAARYRMLFLGKYYETVDGVRHPFPTLDGSSFRDVVASGDAWLVNCAPLAGLTVEARVSRDGRWVEINQVSYASQ